MTITKEKFKNFWKKFWFFVWKDDSVRGWILSILFIFIIIKFVFLPLLSLTTGTSLPLAIVESCSMYHDGNILGSFDKWWERNSENYEDFNIGKDDFKEYIFKKGFNKGDVLFITGAKPENVMIGDVIIFRSPQIGKDVIHRVVSISNSGNERVFTTMGDNNGITQFFEQNIKENQIVGKAKMKLIPYIGWIKLLGADLFNTILGRGNFGYINDGFCEE